MSPVQPPADGGADAGNSKDATQLQTLVRLAEQAEYFHTPEGEAYALIPLDGHRETWRVKSPTFKRRLVKLFFDLNDKPPSTRRSRTPSA